MKLRLKEIIERHTQLKTEIKDIEATLKNLRGNDWRNGIDKDGRYTVKVLYREHGSKSMQLEKLENTEVISNSANIEVIMESET